MMIYLAAPWKDLDQMPAIADQIEALGHQITHKWWLAESVPEVHRTPEFLKQMAALDTAGVKAAKLVVLINSAKSEGKSLEQGIAIADGKPIVAVGKIGEHSKNVFHYLPNYLWVTTLDELYTTLKTIKWLLQE